MIALLLLGSLYFNSGFADQLLRNGAELYEKREDINNVYKALNLFEKKLSKEPNSAEAHWRASMANYYIGNKLKDRKKRKKHFKKGIKHAKSCKKITKGKLVDCHFWLGTNIALFKQEKGLVHMAFGLKDIFKHFEKSKQLDPTYASAGPFRMLALLSYKAPGFLGGDTKKAYKYINEAIKISPKEPLNIHIKVQFLLEDDKEKVAIKLMEEFISKAEPNSFAFYESRSSFEEMKHYLKHRKWPH